MHYYIAPMALYIEDQEFIDQFEDIRLNLDGFFFYAKSSTEVIALSNYEYKKDDAALHISNRAFRWGEITI